MNKYKYAKYRNKALKLSSVIAFAVFVYVYSYVLVPEFIADRGNNDPGVESLLFAALTYWCYRLFGGIDE